MASDEGKVFEFSKRYEDRFKEPTKLPRWVLTYILDKDTNTKKEVEGYLVSIGPTMFFSSTEKLDNINDLVFSIPYDRFIDLEKAKET